MSQNLEELGQCFSIIYTCTVNKTNFIIMLTFYPMNCERSNNNDKIGRCKKVAEVCEAISAIWSHLNTPNFS